VNLLIKALLAYGTSWTILLLALYFRERAKVGRLSRRVILVMTEMTALFALVPATAYVIVSEVLRRGR
jgi:hypothetical protein